MMGSVGKCRVVLLILFATAGKERLRYGLDRRLEDYVLSDAKKRNLLARIGSKIEYTIINTTVGCNVTDHSSSYSGTPTTYKQMVNEILLYQQVCYIIFIHDLFCRARLSATSNWSIIPFSRFLAIALTTLTVTVPSTVSPPKNSCCRVLI